MILIWKKPRWKADWINCRCEVPHKEEDRLRRTERPSRSIAKMSGSVIRLISSILRHGVAGDKELLLKRKTSASGILTFLVSLLQRNPFSQALLAVGIYFKRSRCRSRIFILLGVVLALFLLWALFGSPFRYCVNYTPLYVRRTLDEKYEVLFPHSVEVTNSCPFCQDLKLSSLTCYQAKLFCNHDPAFEDKRRRFLCDCNCGAFGSRGAESTPSEDSNSQKVNILFFTSRDLVLSASSQYEMLYYEAAKVLPDFNAYMFGPGFEGYDREQSLKENLASTFPGVQFDVLFIQVPSKFHFTDSVYSGIQELSKELMVVLRLHECRYGLCEDHLTKTNAHIAVFSYARDLLQYSHHIDKLLIHSPHVVHPPIYNNYSVYSPARTTDVLLAGGYSRDYPFGRRLYNMIQEGVITGAKVLTPPSVHLEVLPDVQYQVYINSLESAKIVLVTSSVDRLLLIKYGEVAMSGALIAGDIPLGHHAELRSGMLELTNDMSDQEIVKVLNYYISSFKEREAKVLQARRLFLSQYTTWKFFSKMQDAIKLYQNGGRGLIYPQYFVGEDILERPSCTEFYSHHILFDFHVLRHRFRHLFS